MIPSYSGPTWWISNNGDDEFGDGSKENPFQSIVWPFQHVVSNDQNQQGFGFFNDGDTIRIMASNDDYHTAGSKIQISRNEGDPNTNIEAGGISYSAQLTNFTIMGDSNDPSDARINGSPQGHFVLNGIKATFKNLTLQNSNNENAAGAIDAFDAEIIVDNTFFRDNYSGNSGGAIQLFKSSASIITAGISCSPAFCDASHLLSPAIISNFELSEFDFLTIIGWITPRSLIELVRSSKFVSSKIFRG